MNNTSIIFDLDGTLLDTSQGVISAFIKVLAEEKIEPKCKLDISIIGPPLKDTFVRITGLSDNATLLRMIQKFKESYDSDGYKICKPFQGIENLLSLLQKRNIPVFIATNKRSVPTKKIVSFLNWENLFSDIYSSDLREPPFENKAAMLKELLVKNMLDKESTCYVGDTIDDLNSARSNSLKFIRASWGYGTFTDEELSDVFLNALLPDDILKILA